ncbi:NADPH dehydrogenase NamA [Thermoflavimicrobium dichotomicum]|uniref:NADPH2 dehydrogenase n=1 Tax=Thermoflavimicrobium dichotomicum TaxID=46223 RepID=A0A1I3V8F3_9BACL|nr:NADPH dehydrogenase NamA [Thermoflavimicrobium dichotomicum]SFJ90646.1 NADPH2 dehydrogenase [Thermoflavimicrobium dichotomicum]
MSLIFQPFQLRNCTIPNRIVCSPMCMYSANEDAKVTDWHIVHYGTRAAGKVGLLMIEATAVESRGRISMKDLGLWSDEQMEGLAKIVSFAQSQGVKTAIQLAHAGRKAVVNEPIIAPSPIPFRSSDPVPDEMTYTDIQNVIQAFGQAARRAKEIGFDIVEVHAAHGYLIHQFLSPLSNKRTDEYGGSLENRARFLKEVIRTVRDHWGEEAPLFVRISAVDYHPDGLTLSDSIQIARWMKEWGVDLVDVSSGGTLPQPPSSIYPGYQVTYAEAIKKEAEIATGTVGLITTVEQAEEILGNGRADLVFLGRELLRNPYWVLHAAQKRNLEYIGPTQYSRAF